MKDLNKEAIEKELREHLRQFPLYKENHWIGVYIDKHVHISYAPTQDRIKCIPLTRFDIEIQEEVCYILGFFIEKKDWRKGYGKKLVDLIEDFSKKTFKCNRFITTPSGKSAEKGEDGICFWEKQSYKYFEGYEVEKVL